jgi:hypothetical protein
MVGKKIKVAFWRISARDIPAGEAERTDWLFAQWRLVDDWVCSRLTPA